MRTQEMLSYLKLWVLIRQAASVCADVVLRIRTRITYDNRVPSPFKYLIYCSQIFTARYIMILIMERNIGDSLHPFIPSKLSFLNFNHFHARWSSCCSLLNIWYQNSGGLSRRFSCLHLFVLRLRIAVLEASLNQFNRTKNRFRKP